MHTHVQPRTYAVVKYMFVYCFLFKNNSRGIHLSYECYLPAGDISYCLAVIVELA